MTFDELADGWEVWAESATKAVLAYRPDVFDTERFPAACLPTIYVTKGQRDRRPGRPEPDPDEAWYVTLYLEPEVSRETMAYDDREGAVAGAVDLARVFAAGGIDYRGLYQVPREAYLEKLDDLTGHAVGHEGTAGPGAGATPGE